MGTLTAGIKEIFSSAKITGSNVMLCGNDGTPDGHITMADLASVLGVPTFKGVNTYDYNSVSATSLTTYYFSSSSPLNAEGFFMVIALNNGGATFTNIQTFYSYDGHIIKRRMWDWSASAWTEWVDA